jgi:hypothetical protein
LLSNLPRFSPNAVTINNANPRISSSTTGKPVEVSGVKLLFEVEPFKPHGFTIFCEDLREEITGQTSFVGVYGDAIFIGEPLPVNLAKLSLAIHLLDEPREKPAKIVLKIARPAKTSKIASSVSILMQI